MVVSLADLHKVRFYRSKESAPVQQAGEFGPAGAVSVYGSVQTSSSLVCAKLRASTMPWARSSTTAGFLSININPGGPQGGSADQYFVGQFDGANFTEDHPGSGPHWADWGEDFYASTSFSNIPAVRIVSGLPG